MFKKDLEEINNKLFKIEEKDENYTENPKWKYLRRQQDLMYLAEAMDELKELKSKVDFYNKKIATLEKYIEDHKGILKDGTNKQELL